MDTQSDNVPTSGTIVPPEGSDYFGFSFCIQQQLSTAPLINNNGLLGRCHFYEDLNYPEPPDPEEYQGFDVILNLIRSGTQSAYAAGPALNPALFNDDYDNPWTFIMTPRNVDSEENLNDPTTQNYPDQFAQLVALIHSLIPNTEVVAYNYNPVGTEPNEEDENSPLYKFNYQGVALFEYDSNADGNGNADWRLWFEATSEIGRNLFQNPPNGGEQVGT